MNAPVCVYVVMCPVTVVVVRHTTHMRTQTFMHPCRRHIWKPAYSGPQKYVYLWTSHNLGPDMICHSSKSRLVFVYVNAQRNTSTCWSAQIWFHRWCWCCVTHISDIIISVFAHRRRRRRQRTTDASQHSEKHTTLTFVDTHTHKHGHISRIATKTCIAMRTTETLQIVLHVERT